MTFIISYPYLLLYFRPIKSVLTTKNNKMKQYVEKSDLFINFHYSKSTNEKVVDGAICEHSPIIEDVSFFYRQDFGESYLKIVLTEDQIISAYEAIKELKKTKVLMTYDNELIF